MNACVTRSSADVMQNDVYCKNPRFSPPFISSTGTDRSRAVVRGCRGPMHERALRRRKKVVRRSRVPLWVWRAGGTNDPDAQSSTTPHRAPKGRARGRWRPWPHAEPKPKPEWLRWLLLLLLLLLLSRGTPRRSAVSCAWRTEATPSGRGTDANARIATNDAAVRHDFVVIGRKCRRTQHTFGAR